MLGDNIKSLRKSRSFTQEELAARLHVTRQTISKWEKGYSVPDADLLSRMAEELDVPVTELLGAPSSPPADPDPIVEQLSRLNEQLAIKNRRSARRWRIVAIVLAVLILVPAIAAVLSLVSYRAQPEEEAGSVAWTCQLDGASYVCGVAYTKDYRIIAGFSDAETDLADQVIDVMDCRTAPEARDALYEWFESRGGTVEVLRQEGLPLPVKVSE